MAQTSTPLLIENLSFRYQRRDELALEGVSMRLEPGEILLLAGSSGCGKTTLMRCINGLIPRTYKGEMTGGIQIFGEPVENLTMARLSQQVGTVLQDPERQIVSSHVLNEVAFGLENLNMPRADVLRRVDETLDYLGLTYLRNRETFQLSGGEKQKIALAGVLAMRPRILLMDEPLASLDPASAQEILEVFRRLANDGYSVMMVEHRVEDVLHVHPEHVVYLDDGKVRYQGDSDGLMRVVDTQRIKLPAPIIVERARHTPPPPAEARAVPAPTDETLLRFENVNFRYKPDLPEVLHDLNFSVHTGDIIAILGHNGAGKTTLVKHALGLLKPTSGRVLLEGKDTHQLTVAQAAHTIGYVFQSPSQMLFAPSVAEELAFGPRNLRHPEEQIKKDVAWAIQTVHLEEELPTPPLALSFGQQKRVSIASVLAMRSRILMMDEPTAGQDYWNYRAFMDSILAMPGFDSILFITHDLDLAIIYANRVMLVDGGRVMADGPTHEVLQDVELLRRCRVLPTSLLQLNLDRLPQTGRFLSAERLAHFAG